MGIHNTLSTDTSLYTTLYMYILVYTKEECIIKSANADFQFLLSGYFQRTFWDFRKKQHSVNEIKQWKSCQSPFLKYQSMN